MRKSVQVLLIFVAGAAVGGGAVESYHHSHDAQLTLSRKLRCQKLARDFVQRRSKYPSTAVLSRMDYSASRASCIVAENDVVYTSSPPLWSYNVIDVLTEEVLFATPCSDSVTSECHSKARKSQDDAFDRALRNAEK